MFSSEIFHVGFDLFSKSPTASWCLQTSTPGDRREGYLAKLSPLPLLPRVRRSHLSLYFLRKGSPLLGASPVAMDTLPSSHPGHLLPSFEPLLWPLCLLADFLSLETRALSYGACTVHPSPAISTHLPQLQCNDSTDSLHELIPC